MDEEVKKHFGITGVTVRCSGFRWSAGVTNMEVLRRIKAQRKVWKIKKKKKLLLCDNLLKLIIEEHVEGKIARDRPITEFIY